MRISMIVVAALIISPAAAQESKSPALPPINPAAARLDQTITDLDGPGFAIAYGPGFELLVAGCDRGTIQFWNKDVLLGIRTGSGTGQILKGHEGPITALVWNGGPTLVSWGADRKLVFWSIADGKPSQKQAIACFVRAMAMSPDGKLLAIGGDDDAVQLWDVASAKPQAKLVEHKDWVTAIAFSGDGKWLASGANDESLTLWESAGSSYKKVRNLPAPPMPPPKTPTDPAPIRALAFSPDAKMLAVGLANGKIDLINLGDGKILRSLTGHTSAITSLGFHPSAPLLVSSSKDRTLRLWNPANGQAYKTLEGHGAWIEGFAFTTQFTRIASVSADQTVRIWDLTEPAKK